MQQERHDPVEEKRIKTEIHKGQRDEKGGELFPEDLGSTGCF